MTLKDWKGKSIQDAGKELKNLREELFGLRLKKATGQLEKSHRLGEVRRSIARGLTYLREQTRLNKERLPEVKKA